MTERFSDVLADNENVLGSYKPDKFKFFFMAILTYCVIGLVIAICATLAIIFLPNETQDDGVLWYKFIPSVVFAAGLIVNCGLDVIWYKNVSYCYTNKRIIIRCGVFGVYYRCLALDSIGVIDVSITVFDKMLSRGTGTLRFGSLARPTVPNTGMYAFMHVKSPYEVYKCVKDAVDKAKNLSSNTQVN